MGKKYIVDLLPRIAELERSIEEWKAGASARLETISSQAARIEQLEARIKELEGEALFHRVLGPQRTESDMNEILSLKARIAELEAENARLRSGRCEAGHEDCDA